MDMNMNNNDDDADIFEDDSSEYGVEIIAMLKCQKCSNMYKWDRHMWFMLECSHHTCNFCLVNSGRFKDCCAVCRVSATRFEVPLVEELVDLLNVLRVQVALCRRTSRDWTQDDDVVLINPDGTRCDRQFKCQKCGSSENEQNLHICETCRELKYENHEMFKTFALCSTCTIREHIRQGHKTVDFLPYFRAYMFKAKLQPMRAAIDDFEKVSVDRKDEMDMFRKANEKAREQFDQLIDMMRRSKSTNQLNDCMNKLKKFIKTAKNINMNATTKLSEESVALEKETNELEKWIERMAVNCMEEEEVLNLEG